MNCWDYEDAMTRNQEILEIDCRFHGALHLREAQRWRGCEPRRLSTEEKRKSHTRVVADGTAYGGGALAGGGAPAGEVRRGEVAPPPWRLAEAAVVAEGADNIDKWEGPTVGSVGSRLPCRPWKFDCSCCSSRNKPQNFVLFCFFQKNFILG